MEPSPSCYSSFDSSRPRTGFLLRAAMVILPGATHRGSTRWVQNSGGASIKRPPRWHLGLQRDKSSRPVASPQGHPSPLSGRPDRKLAPEHAPSHAAGGPHAGAHVQSRCALGTFQKCRCPSILPLHFQEFLHDTCVSVCNSGSLQRPDWKQPACPSGGVATPQVAVSEKEVREESPPSSSASALEPTLPPAWRAVGAAWPALPARALSCCPVCAPQAGGPVTT